MYTWFTISGMIFALIGLIAIALFLITSERYTRRHEKAGELPRKWIHVVVASFVAVWPFFTSREYVMLLSLGFIIGIVLSRRYRIFNGIHSVRRSTVGDLLFPLAILICAAYAKSPAIFAVAILHLSLADGLAAVIGTIWGKSNRYRILGQQKSVVGSLTFVVVSMLIVQIFLLSGAYPLEPGSWMLAVLIPVIGVCLENASPYGFDNLTIPLFVMLTLNML